MKFRSPLMRFGLPALLALTLILAFPGARSGDPVEANDANRASELAGFPVRAPAGMEPSRIRIRPRMCSRVSLFL